MAAKKSKSRRTTANKSKQVSTPKGNAKTTRRAASKTAGSKKTARRSSAKKTGATKTGAAKKTTKKRAAKAKTKRAKKATVKQAPKVAAKQAKALAKPKANAKPKGVTSKASAKSKAPAAAKSKSKARTSAAKPKSKTVAPLHLSTGLNEGARAPSFTLQDQTGTPVSSAELKGKPYVLYFYPKDDTPGCTREACGFRDNLPKFDKGKVAVFGVSPDSTKSHEKFAQKYDLPFTLLSDPDKELANAYGVWVKKQNYGREYMGIERSTFLIGADGIVRKAWRRVKVDGHVDKVLEQAQGL